MGSALLYVMLALFAPRGQESAGPQQANGVKVGEVTATTALVWVRATARAERNAEGPVFDGALVFGQAQLPDGATLADMRDAVPGAAASMRLRFASEGGEERVTPWVAVTAANDHAHVFALDGLTPRTAYLVISEARADPDGGASSVVTARFRTAPAAGDAAPVRFVASTCQDFQRRDDAARGHRIYRAMLAREPDFLAHLGDFLYYDRPGPFATTRALARYKWNRITALELQRDFHRAVPAYFVKDDHDLLHDDCWPGQTYGDLTWEDGLALHREQLPVPRADQPPYRTVRWGRDLQVWLLEGREFRSRNRMADGPNKTILGAEQRAWLAATLAASDATFKVILSATPLVGPDRETKNDNHANAGFAYEGYHLRKLFAEHGAVVVTGDRHWQYVSRDPVSGLLELGCGPASDAHAGGYPRRREFEPDFARVLGGFLEVEVTSERMTLTHRDVGGEVVNTVDVPAAR